MSDFPFAAAKVGFVAQDAARNSQTSMKNSSLENENKILKQKCDAYANAYEKIRGSNIECQKSLSRIIPYINAYDKIKKVALEEWDPLIKVATLLKQTNPELFKELSEKCKMAAKTPADMFVPPDPSKN